MRTFASGIRRGRERIGIAHVGRSPWSWLAVAGAVLTLVVPIGVVDVAVAAERGITATEVVIGTSTPLSGPAAPWGATARGAEAYVQHINEQGGIHGRRIRFEIRDDAYLPPRAVANVRELVDRVGVFAIVGLIGTANAMAVRDYIVNNQVIWITPTADANLWVGYPNTRYLFVTYPNYFHEAQILARYAMNELGAKSIAVFYQNDDYGKTGLAGVQRALEQGGGKAQVVAAVPYELTETDLSSHALRLRQSGADALILYATPRHGAMIAGEIAKIGYRPHRLATFTLADPVMAVLAGPAWEGMIVPSFMDFPGMNPKVDRVLDIITKRNPELAKTPFNALAGVSFLEPFLEGLRRAGPDLSRESFVRAMESIQHWDGELLQDVTFGPGRRQGTNAIFLAQYRDGKPVRISDWLTYPVEF
ncbi:MAG: ABC transporter substrate-binding protein [Bacillota bacterium]